MINYILARECQDMSCRDKVAASSTYIDTSLSDSETSPSSDDTESIVESPCLCDGLLAPCLNLYGSDFL